MAKRPTLTHRETGRLIFDVAVDVANGNPELDAENAFMLYATFCGDAERTGHALNIPAAAVLKLAEAGQWNEKLRGILELKRSAKPGDVERAVNRALNFVQAHRLRLFLERVLRRLCEASSDDLENLMATFKGAAGQDSKYLERRFSTRPFADLASALEKCHAMTYQALNDTAPERKAREDAPDHDRSAGELHAKIAAAFAKGRDPASQLAEAQDRQL